MLDCSSRDLRFNSSNECRGCIITAPRFVCHVVHSPGSRQWYLIDPDGYRRAFRTDRTFHTMFETTEVIEPRGDTGSIAWGPDLSRNTFLARVRGTTVNYLIIGESKHRVTESAFSACRFDPDYVVDIPAHLFDAYLDGRPWFQS